MVVYTLQKIKINHLIICQNYFIAFVFEKEQKKSNIILCGRIFLLNDENYIMLFELSLSCLFGLGSFLDSIDHDSFLDSIEHDFIRI